MLTIWRAERIDAEATFDIRVEAIWHQCRTAYTQEQLKQLGIRPGVTALAEPAEPSPRQVLNSIFCSAGKYMEVRRVSLDDVQPVFELYCEVSAEGKYPARTNPPSIETFERALAEVEANGWPV